MSNNFLELMKDLQANPAVFGKTQLLSISIDLPFDKPTLLHEYGARYAEFRALAVCDRIAGGDSQGCGFLRAVVQPEPGAERAYAADRAGRAGRKDCESIFGE